MDVEGWREMSSYERRLIDHLLSEPFPGRDELVDQLSDALVKTADDHGCLEIRVIRRSPSPTKFTVPVEGFTYQPNGLPLAVMLFVGLTARIAYMLEFNSPDDEITLSEPESLVLMYPNEAFSFAVPRGTFTTGELPEGLRITSSSYYGLDAEGHFHWLQFGFGEETT